MIKVGGIYKHSKSGKLYKVIGIARHSETLKELVVYEPQYEHSEYDNRYWVRPVEMWEDIVKIGSKLKARFELLD